MRSAVFVDAGYLYAQGSTALADRPVPRVGIVLDVPKAIAKLVKTSASRTDNAPVLRIYWYDGLLRRELSPDQQSIAFMENVKLRLGIVNLAGQQKGVDSLIVTDLVELARNQAITDAVLLSGDEDLRIGVQIAQSFGVRVHLIGIEPSRGSQSLPLLQEVDTTTTWNKADVRSFMAVNPGPGEHAQEPIAPVSPAISSDTVASLERTIKEFLISLNSEEVTTINELGETQQIPPEFDRKLLAMCGRILGKYLNETEKVQMRKMFKQRVTDRANTP